MIELDLDRAHLSLALRYAYAGLQTSNREDAIVGGAILPEMMRWLWRDGAVSTDPKDMVERGFREGVKK